MSDVNKDQNDDDDKAKPDEMPLATLSEVFSFAETFKTKLYIAFGLFFAMIAGFALPASIFYFARIMGNIAAVAEEGLDPILKIVYAMMILGVVSLISETLQSGFLETAATDMTINLKRKWFEAVVRQDMAYFDLQDISGTATIISNNGAKFKKGVSKKLGNGVQFTCTVFAGFGIAFYASWKVTLAVLACVPVMALNTGWVLKLNQSKTSRDNASYAKAGAIVYQVAANIRTILALNAADEMIARFEAATQKAYDGALSQLVWLGVANGGLMGSFMLAYIVVVGYGSWLLYDAVKKTGCDPSDAITGNEACNPAGQDIFLALMGVIFGGATLPQISTAMEAIVGSRAACFPALMAIHRKSETGDERLDAENTERSEALQRRSTLAALPKYSIDVSSPFGHKPDKVIGTIEFKNVSFSYPTRQEVQVFDGFNLKIEAGKTVALVGPSGSGKSTSIQLIERFYDPTFGSVMLDGIDLRQLNVAWLRQHIGLVSQEPALFATTIKENIRVAKPDATDKEVEEAARRANAHDFISSLQFGYDTHVGDKGAQLSGGQKQRIAIARTLITNPKIILLDEATSALDSESEAIVQEALDDIMAKGNATVVVIAHRLSTIRNADMIAVVEKGKVAETGTHDELISKKGKYFGLVEAQKGKNFGSSSSFSTTGTETSDSLSRSNSAADLTGMDIDTEDAPETMKSSKKSKRSSDATESKKSTKKSSKRASESKERKKSKRSSEAAETETETKKDKKKKKKKSSKRSSEVDATEENEPSSDTDVEEGKKSSRKSEKRSSENTEKKKKSSKRKSKVSDPPETSKTSDAVIDIHKVHFHYPSRPNSKIFRGLGFEVKEGETVAIVGPSGQGKSTIIQLIEEFYRPSKGRLEYNGDDIKDLNVRWYRNELGLVSQEPTLFDGSIAENIKFGMPEATQEQIEEAAKKANAHNFIMGFPDGYNTSVGSASSSQISGGQKQRIAIARALLRKPKVLLLDEATSALDTESEKIVQEALDSIMADSKLITIVIAHRLSTIRGASKICYVDHGKVREVGTYEELMAKPNGHYKRLEALQTMDQGLDRKSILDAKKLYAKEDKAAAKKAKKRGEVDEEETSNDKPDDETAKMIKKKAKEIAKDEYYLFCIGSVGALLNGIIFPGQGFVFAYLIEVFYQYTLPCEDGVSVPFGYVTCQDYWDATAKDMQDLSFKTIYLLIALIFCSMIGSIIMFVSFGTATERINKKVRDRSFRALIRQEVAWYDVRSVGQITSQLSDDAAMIHSFSGEPIRTFMMSLSSVGAGLVVSFYFMWEFAFVALGILPFMAFGEYMQNAQMIGTDEGDIEKTAVESSEGAVVIETLVNIRVVASLSLEDARVKAYTKALENKGKRSLCRNCLAGTGQGLGSFFQMWGYGLMFYFGSWLMLNRGYNMREYLVSLFGLMLSLTGLAAATAGLTDAEKAKEAANRIFELTERQSEIDPLSDKGKRQH